MAKIITEETLKTARKLDEHKCFKKLEPFMRGILNFGTFCPICGENLMGEKIITTSKCSSCGGSLFYLEYMNYCPYCGVEFEK